MKTKETFNNWSNKKFKLHSLQNHKKKYFCEREIWFSSIGCNIGFEQDGKNELFERPVLIVKKFNNELFWGVPMTSQNKKGKYYFNFEYNDHFYSCILSQLRLFDAKRLTRKIRVMPKQEVAEIKQRIKKLL